MSDLAAWPMKINEEHEGIVIHVHGSEHFITQDEWDELWHHANVAFKGYESFGTEYQELVESAAAQASQPKGGLLAKLGLKREAPIKRRQL